MQVWIGRGSRPESGHSSPYQVHISTHSCGRVQGSFDLLHFGQQGSLGSWSIEEFPLKRDDMLDQDGLFTLGYPRRT